MQSPSARTEASGTTDLVGWAERIDPKSCLNVLGFSVYIGGKIEFLRASFLSKILKVMTTN